MCEQAGSLAFAAAFFAVDVFASSAPCWRPSSTPFFARVFAKSSYNFIWSGRKWRSEQRSARGGGKDPVVLAAAVLSCPSAAALYNIIYRIYYTWIGQEATLAKARANRGASPWSALSNFDQHFSGEKPWDDSLDENSPYFAPAATWDWTRDLPLSAGFRVVPTVVLYDDRLSAYLQGAQVAVVVLYDDWPSAYLQGAQVAVVVLYDDRLSAYLQGAQVTVVVLYDLRRQVLQHVLLEASQEERQDLAVQRLHGERTWRPQHTRTAHRADAQPAHTHVRSRVYW